MSGGEGVAVELVAGEMPPEWAAFVGAQGAADWYHDVRWAGVMSRAYGLRAVVALARRKSDLVGGIWLTQCPRFPCGWRLVAGPFLASRGLLLRDEAERAVVQQALGAAVRRAGLRHVELREREAGVAAGTGDLVAMTLPLPGSAEALWDALDPKVRNQVRKGQKSGLTVARGVEQVQAFWEVYARHQRAHGTPTHGAGYFRGIAAVFGADCDVLVVRKDGEVIGGMMAVCGRGAFVALNACSLRAYNSLCVNHLLYWEALTLAVARGAARFDFGRSVYGSGTFDFKKQWGAGPVRLRYHDLLGGRVQAPVEMERLKLAAQVWSRLPGGVANRLGPRLRPFLA